MAVRKLKPKAAVVKPAKAAPETCFTVMPFGGWFDDYYESIYKPAIEHAGLGACRADDLYRPSTIVTDIWTYTKSAKLILADLSGKNPNVFYELGLAHALAKPAILVTESMDDVPFDLRALRVLQYDKNQPRWGEQLQEKITASIKEVVASPLQAVLPAFLTVRHEAKQQTVTEQEKAFLELRREIDLLRNEITSVRTLRARPDPDEARARIRDYMERGAPEELIYRRMRELGVPSMFIDRRIAEFKKVQADLLSPDSKAPET